MEEILFNGFNAMGIPCTEKQIEQLEIYAKRLVEWNEKMNLTGITAPEEIAVKHFLDSASALSVGRVSGKVIDVGTGAGFPGLVMKIMKPELEVTLLDSLNKRLVFLAAVINELKLDKIELVHSRAEDGAHKVQYRENFDVAVSRAVAAMPLLCELCLPYVMPGGMFVALKGPSAADEFGEAKKAIKILGGGNVSIKDAFVPDSDLEHKIIIVKKVRQTPIKFPRKPALISKNPIETCYNISKKTAR